MKVVIRRPSRKFGNRPVIVDGRKIGETWKVSSMFRPYVWVFRADGETRVHQYDNLQQLRDACQRYA